MGGLSRIVSSTGALHPKAAVNIIQNLLQTVAQTRPIWALVGWRVGPPGIELAQPVKVPVTGRQGNAQLADRLQIAVAIAAGHDLIHADGRAFVGKAVRRGTGMGQGFLDLADGLAGQIFRDDVGITDRLQAVVAAVLEGVEIVDDLVDRQLLVAGVLFQGLRIIHKRRHVKDNALHAVKGAAAGLKLVPLITPDVHVRYCATDDGLDASRARNNG